jgi:hypothetical protein
MMGMFADILLWPARMLLPQWAFAIRHVGAFGLAVATLAALTLLLDSSNQANSNRANAAVYFSSVDKSRFHQQGLHSEKSIFLPLRDCIARRR